MAVKLAKQGPMKRLSINLYGQEIAETKYKEWQDVIKQSKSSELTTEAIDQVHPPSMNLTDMPLQFVVGLELLATVRIGTRRNFLGPVGARLEMSIPVVFPVECVVTS